MDTMVALGVVVVARSGSCGPGAGGCAPAWPLSPAFEFSIGFSFQGLGSRVGV